MESNCTNCNENVYFACRKKAASYNEKLNSRESAAELLGISPSTLANYHTPVATPSEVSKAQREAARKLLGGVK